MQFVLVGSGDQCLKNFVIVLRCDVALDATTATAAYGAVNTYLQLLRAGAVGRTTNLLSFKISHCICLLNAPFHSVACYVTKDMK